jgi:heptosyltransferase-2
MTRRILVIRLSSLGDVVLTAPVYKNLRAHWPDARICVLVKPQFAPVLESNPHVDEVLVFRGLWSTVREIRRRGFTHLLDLHGTLRTLLIRWLAGIGETVVYRKNAVARRLYVLFRWSSPELTKHSLDRYLESLSAWGVPTPHRDLELGDYSGASKKNGTGPGAKVLIAQTSFLGDALLTLPLAKRVKELLPGARISVLTRPETATVFRQSPWVDEVLEQDKKGEHRGIGGLFRLARSLREKGFDLALGAHRSFRTALLLRLAKLPRRIGFSSSPGSFLYHETVYFSWAMPDLERNLALLTPLKPDLRPDRADSLYLSERRGDDARAAEESVAKRLNAAGVRPGERIAALHPGSVWPTKRWFPERFARLAARLHREAGARVMLVGGPGDRELAASIAERSGVEVLNWVGETTLPELIAAAKRWGLLVTNDSGPMHVAAAHGVPTLAIFGPTTRELGFFPYGEGHRVLEANLACRPCGLHGSKACPEGHFLCMELIGVDAAFQNAVEMLKREGQPA